MNGATVTVASIQCYSTEVRGGEDLDEINKPGEGDLGRPRQGWVGQS